MAQRTELNFIIQGKENKHYKDLMRFPCGLRQSKYTQAYDRAQETLKALQSTDTIQYRLTMRYLPVYKPNTVFQLSII